MVAKYIILTYMDDGVIHLYEYIDTIKEIIEILEEKYGTRSKSYIQLLLEKYNTIKMSKGDDVNVHIDQMSLIKNILLLLVAQSQTTCKFQWC